MLQKLTHVHVIPTKMWQSFLIQTSKLRIYITQTYVVGSKSFRTDIQKLCQMENAVRDI